MNLGFTGRQAKKVFFIGILAAILCLAFGHLLVSATSQNAAEALEPIGQRRMFVGFGLGILGPFKLLLGEFQDMDTIAFVIDDFYLDLFFRA